jgi:hypothetical protein
LTADRLLKATGSASRPPHPVVSVSGAYAYTHCQFSFWQNQVTRRGLVGAGGAASGAPDEPKLFLVPSAIRHQHAGGRLT